MKLLMNRRKSQFFLAAGALAAAGLTASWFLDIRVAELAQLVRSRQGLAGIGESAALDVHQTLQGAKNLSFGTGVGIGAIGAGALVAIGLTGKRSRTIHINLPASTSPEDLELLRNALYPSVQEFNFSQRVNHETPRDLR